MEITNKRFEFIDFIKLIGLIGIMVAHVDAPDWALMVRAFDVPLMVMLSAYLMRYSYDRHCLSPDFKDSSFIMSRILRLLVPTHIFLVFLFVMYAVRGHIFPLDFYIFTFLCSLYGMAYVWIILIYIYTGICTPIFRKFSRFKGFSVIILLLYVLYEIMYYKGILVDSRLFVNTFYYFIPYGAVAYLGFVYPAISKRLKVIIASVSALIFAGIAIYIRVATGHFERVSIATFPPKIYYLSYGIAVSYALMIVFETLDLSALYKSRFVRFVSDRSLWIYLWHIFALAVYDQTVLFGFWYLELAAVFFSSCLIAFIQSIIVKKLRQKTELKFLKYL